MQTRYLSLDVLRGLTIAFMILVNTPGDWDTVYAPFLHAAWHGFTPTDLVFPTFLFVVGNAMSFSMRKYQEGPVFWEKVIKRTLIIFVIGVLLNAFPFYHHTDQGAEWFSWSSLRVMGVLQRIALSYFAAAILLRYASDIAVGWVAAGLLLGYWALLYFGGGTSEPYSLEGNIVRKVDLYLLGAPHLYQGFGIAFEPEGILSTLPAIANVLAGYWAGRFIQSQGSTRSTSTALVVVGVTLLGLGLLWDSVFPINKPLWTSSYVIFSTGWDILLLSLLIFIIDIKNYRSWTYFFEVFGKNPLFIYILAWVIIALFNEIQIADTVISSWIYQKAFRSWLNPYNASLAFATTYTFAMWVIAYIMDRRRIYVKV